MNTRYLVTGGGGFIGSHVVRHLLGKKHKVRILDNFLTGNRNNLRDVAGDIELIEGDIRNEKDSTLAVQDIDYIVHLAALPSVPRSVENPVLSTDINVNGTVTLLNAAQRNGVKRIVFASSSSVYGDSPEFPRHEDQYPQPLSPYAVSKLAGEFYMKCFYKLHGLETVTLRYFNVFGPRQDPNSQYAAVIPKFITAVLSGKKPIVYGDGEQSRDFTFIEDLVQGIYKACHADRAPGSVMNVACGRRTSLNQLLGYLQELSGTEVNAEYTASRPGDVRDSFASIDRARDLLGYEPRFSMAEGLEKTFNWYREQAEKKGETALKHAGATSSVNYATV